jgi:hypothetical protein
MLVMPQQEQEATLGLVRSFRGSSPETASGEFTLPMLTFVLRARWYVRDEYVPAHQAPPR